MKPSRVLMQQVDEIVFRPLLVARMELHLAPRIHIFPCAAGNRQDRILAIEERAFDGDLPIGQAQCPEALLGLAGNGAHAPAIVGAELLLVLGVVDGIGEGQDIAGAVAFGAEIGDGVRGCALDQRQFLVGGLAHLRGQDEEHGGQHGHSNHHSLHSVGHR